MYLDGSRPTVGWLWSNDWWLNIEVKGRTELSCVSGPAIVSAETRNDRCFLRPVLPCAASSSGYQSNPDPFSEDVQSGKEEPALKRSIDNRTCSLQKMLHRRRLH